MKRSKKLEARFLNVFFLFDFVWFGFASHAEDIEYTCRTRKAAVSNLQIDLEVSVAVPGH